MSFQATLRLDEMTLVLSKKQMTGNDFSTERQ